MQASGLARHSALRDTAAAWRLAVSGLPSMAASAVTPPDTLASWLAQLMVCSAPYTCMQHCQLGAFGCERLRRRGVSVAGQLVLGADPMLASGAVNQRVAACQQAQLALLAARSDAHGSVLAPPAMQPFQAPDDRACPHK